MTGATTGSAPGSSAREVPDPDPSNVAREILLRQLSMGPRTLAQLRTALSKRNVPPDTAEAVLERFTELGLIDDRAYAEALIRSEAAGGGLSRRRVQHRLREKGVPPDIAAEAIGTIGPDDEQQAAVDLARRRVARMSGLDAQTVRRRLSGILARRGYNPDTVRTAVAAAMDADPHDDGCADTGLH